MYDGNVRYIGRVDGGNYYGDNGNYMGCISGAEGSGSGGIGVLSIGSYGRGGSFEGTVAGVMIAFVAIFVVLCFYSTQNMVSMLL